MIRSSSLACLALCLIVGSTPVTAQQQPSAGRVDAGSSTDPNEVVLFPFDDYSIPLTYGLSYNLIQGHREGVVLRPSQTGPDAQQIINHGSVLKVGDEFRIWYLCLGDQDPPIEEGELPRDADSDQAASDQEKPKRGEVTFRVCYATSKDGVNWKKPALGFVKYGADTKNNLIDFPIGDYRVINLIVIEDPADPDSGRRFKMAFQSVKYQSRIAVAWSPDGLHWKENPANPVTQLMTEIHGLIRYNGAYYVNGHGGSPRPGPNAIMPRRMVTYMSYDFEHWAAATALSFDRFGGVIPNPYRGHAGEQIHTGASLWNRGNVVIGFYGQWHGDPADDRRLVTMDLGLITSNDALHFKEPVKDFRIVAGNEEGEIVTHTVFTRLGGAGGGSLFGLALTQGQGWANVGDQTLYWYSVWSQGRVRLATWLRDRLGYFEVPMEIRRRQEVPAPRRGLLQGEQGGLAVPKRPEPKSPWAETSPHFISYPITLAGPDEKIFVNADGLSKDDAYIRVEVLDEQFHVLPGYSMNDCAPITESGFRQPAVWGSAKTLGKPSGPIRVRVILDGPRPEDIRVYAAYVAKE